MLRSPTHCLLTTVLAAVPHLLTQLEALHGSTKLLSMFLNRCNSCWAETQQWGAPSVVSATEEQIWSRTDPHDIYRGEALRKLRNGKVGVRCLC